MSFAFFIISGIAYSLSIVVAVIGIAEAIDSVWHARNPDSWES